VAVRVCVLDVVSIRTDDRTPVLIGSLQQKVLLTMLVANKGRSVSLDAIADELWPDLRPRRWRGCIATLANSVRTAAGDRDLVVSTARGYTLHRQTEAVATDVDELREHLDRARQADKQGVADVAEAMAHRALALYGAGPWTTDFWGWNEAAAEAACILGRALLRRGAYVACISELSRALEHIDWHEGVWACLISAHHYLGSFRRASELARRARMAVGGSAPVLSKIEARLSAANSV
jgi:two-component SAPR family response regulator